MSRIAYVKANVGEHEVDYAIDAVRHGWGTNCYKCIDLFEERFAQFIGAPYAIATSSATGALHMGMAALGIGIDDEVILGDMNWIASVAPVTYLGAKPVLVDIDPVSWCLDPAAVEAAITPRTKAIIAVHLYGNLADIDALLRIGERHGIPVIEDAAEAIGSIWHGKRAGTLGIFGVYSFHGSKTMTTGEGGMFVTSDAELYARMRTLSNHGREQGENRQFWPAVIGYKYKISNVQAAIGCGQLDRIDELVDGKRRVFAAYKRGLAGLPLQLNPEPEGTQNGYWMPSMIVDEGVPFDRDDLLRSFADADIESRIVFWPLSMLDMFEARPENKIAYSVYPRAINLPSFAGMTDDEVERVCGVVRSYLSHS